MRTHDVRVKLVHQRDVGHEEGRERVLVKRVEAEPVARADRMHEGVRADVAAVRRDDDTVDVLKRDVLFALKVDDESLCDDEAGLWRRERG